MRGFSTEPEEGLLSTQPGRKKRRFLAPQEKYEIWMQLVRGETTVGDAAERARVDRSTIANLREVARQGALDALSQSRPVALDWYAQDDAGNVCYFGEDVFNYEDGVVADTEGTWIAGEDGPPGMIMPADSQVGQAYRPENIPDFVGVGDASPTTAAGGTALGLANVLVGAAVGAAVGAIWRVDCLVGHRRTAPPH